MAERPRRGNRRNHGCGETEISFSTKNVLIECAWFEPVAIRRATRFLRLHTEASTRFAAPTWKWRNGFAALRGAFCSSPAANCSLAWSMFIPASV